MATHDAPVASELLDSWKEIAAYLKSDESTVRRWEEEGLPVHRRAHKKQASVYAYKSEIDAWWQHESHAKETNESATQRARTPRWIAASVIVLLLVALGLIPRFRRVREEPIEQITQITTLPGLEDTPSWSPDGRMIAFTSDVDGRLQIYLQRVGAGQPVRWSVSEHNEAQPAWSPDGKWIAFTGSGGDVLRIFVIPSNGGAATPLTGGDAHALMPNWSRDGRWLFFSSNRGGALNLWKARFENVALATPHQVTVGSENNLYCRPGP